MIKEGLVTGAPELGTRERNGVNITGTAFPDNKAQARTRHGEGSGWQVRTNS